MSDEHCEHARHLLPHGCWLADIAFLHPPIVAFFGLNLVHVAGFFPRLAATARAFSDSVVYWIGLEDNGYSIPFSVDDSDEVYFARLQEGPVSAHGVAAPYALSRQGYIGSGDWLLVSDRDEERMCFLTKKSLDARQFDAIMSLVRADWT